MTALLDTATEVEEEASVVHRFEQATDRTRELTFGEAEHVRLLRAFGFNDAADTIAAREKIESVPYEALEGYELHVTMAFLPSAYEMRWWGTYRYDTVPITALKALEAAKPHFDTFELWTPEIPTLATMHQPRRLSIDPMIVGIKGARERDRTRNSAGVASLNWRYRHHFPVSRVSFHPIARWGEALESFKTMERSVGKRTRLLQLKGCCDSKLLAMPGPHRFCLECGSSYRTDDPFP